MAELTIIAGCNGSGKSTFAPSFLKEVFIRILMLIILILTESYS